MRKAVSSIPLFGRNRGKNAILVNSNLKKISDIVRRNNGSELLVELRKIDAFKLTKANSAVRPSRRPNRSMTKIVADLYVSNSGASIEKACDAFDCLQAVLPSARLNGLVDLINVCIDKRQCNAAISAYYKAAEEGIYLDLLTQRRLLKLLCLEGRVDDLLALIRASGISADARASSGLGVMSSSAGNIHASMLDNCILYLAEPLIMSGCTELYCDLVVQHLNKRRAKWQVAGAEIAQVISSVIYAKIRRDTYHVKISPSEQAGIHRLLHVLRCYHVDIAPECKAAGVSVSSLHSYVAAVNLERLDKDPMVVMDEMFLAVLPPVDLSGTHFPFLIEEVVDPLLADAQERALLADPYSAKSLQASNECDLFSAAGAEDADADDEPLVADLTLELSRRRQIASAGTVVSFASGRGGKTASRGGLTSRQQVLEYHQRRRMHKQDLVALSLSHSRAATADATAPAATGDHSVERTSVVGALPPQQRNILYHASLFPKQYADEIIDIRRGYSAGRQRVSHMAEVIAGQIMHNMLSQPDASFEIEVLDSPEDPEMESDQNLNAHGFNEEDEEDDLSAYDEEGEEDYGEEDADDEEDDEDDDDEDDEEESEDEPTEAEIMAMVNDLLGPVDGNPILTHSSSRHGDFVGRLEANKLTGSTRPLGHGRQSNVIYDHARDHDSELYHEMRLMGFSNEDHNVADGFDFNDLTSEILGSLPLETPNQAKGSRRNRVPSGPSNVVANSKPSVCARSGVDSDEREPDGGTAGIAGSSSN